MKYIDEFRDADACRKVAAAIAKSATQPWTLMEICGGQTHAIVRYGIDQLLPDSLRLVHGPGCPVCVTPIPLIDQAIAIARTPGAILCSFGDMIRVPGSVEDLQTARAQGGDVRVVYSPMDALEVAAANPDREVCFFAVGFETTAPANAIAVYTAHQRGLTNFSLLVSHVLVPPAIDSILGAPGNEVQGFLAAGHVCTIAGVSAYEDLAAQYEVPIVVTGFEPLDILQGVHMCVTQLERGEARMENQYARSVRADGNLNARALVDQVFQVSDREWRGLGSIPESGLVLRAPYDTHDAMRRFAATTAPGVEDARCIAGEILLGKKRPADCPAFRSVCTPERPLGAPMVSEEGACSAYYRYARTSEVNDV